MIAPAVFSIRAAARMTGLAPELLRAWERRYGAVVPRRADNGRRLYSRADIQHLRLLKAATDAGHPIGNICELTEGELRSLALPAAAGRPRPPPQADLDRLAATLRPRDFVLEVAAPLSGRPVDGPAAEHICAALLRQLRRPGEPDLLVVGDLLLAAVLAAAHGRRLLYLGETDAATAAGYALRHAVPAALVAAAGAEALLAELPPQVEVWALGPGDAPPHVTLLADLAELDAELAATAP